MKLSVIIPCYNEKKTIGLIIERIKEIEFIKNFFLEYE